MIVVLGYWQRWLGGYVGTEYAQSTIMNIINEATVLNLTIHGCLSGSGPWVLLWRAHGPHCLIHFIPSSGCMLSLSLMSTLVIAQGSNI